jgi:hypothetical protein
MRNISIILTTAMLLVFVSYQSRKQRDLDNVKIEYLSELLYEARAENYSLKEYSIKLTDICDKYKSSRDSKRKMVMNYKTLEL